MEPRLIELWRYAAVIGRGAFLRGATTILQARCSVAQILLGTQVYHTDPRCLLVKWCSIIVTDCEVAHECPTITVNLPTALYSRLRRRAEQSRRTVEAELLDVITTAVPVADDLSADLDEAISPLSLLDDAALWRAARSRMADESAAQLKALRLKRQRECLMVTEDQTLAGLVRQYERVMLVRAQAAALLKQRDHDVSELLTA